MTKLNENIIDDIAYSIEIILDLNGVTLNYENYEIIIRNIGDQIFPNFNYNDSYNSSQFCDNIIEAIRKAGKRIDKEEINIGIYCIIQDAINYLTPNFLTEFSKEPITTFSHRASKLNNDKIPLDISSSDSITSTNICSSQITSNSVESGSGSTISLTDKSFIGSPYASTITDKSFIGSPYASTITDESFIGSPYASTISITSSRLSDSPIPSPEQSPR